MPSSIPKITFFNIPPRTLAYYDWLITGLELLEEAGEIEIEYRGHWWDRLLRCHPKALRILRRLSPAFVDFCSPVDSICLTGCLEYKGAVANFAVDIADSPFVFALALLETVDVYFKLQCPKTFDPAGFPINKNIRAPYHPDVFIFQNKIRPGMLGRPLGHSLSLRRNLPILRRWEDLTKTPKSNSIFASFGTIDELPPRTPRTPLPAQYNYFSETTLLARYRGQLHSPNQKRSKVVKILRDMNKPDIDARLWRTEDRSLHTPALSDAEYALHTARAATVINISGLRRSIPYRICDTLLTGGLIATDTLAIKWYQPFEPFEVKEIGDLGYEMDEDVDWPAIASTLADIHANSGTTPDIARARTDAYQRKWSPRAFARYFISQCEQSLSAN